MRLRPARTAIAVIVLVPALVLASGAVVSGAASHAAQAAGVAPDDGSLPEGCARSPERVTCTAPPSTSLTMTVPDGVVLVDLLAVGGAGGGSPTYQDGQTLRPAVPGGPGAMVVGRLAVVADDQVVAETGADGADGVAGREEPATPSAGPAPGGPAGYGSAGTGGGASVVSVNPAEGTDARVLVAGGGGGAAERYESELGRGGGAGSAGAPEEAPRPVDGTGGRPGTESGPGTGGMGYEGEASRRGHPGVGPAGGAGSPGLPSSGGGGGGYFGGGGGGASYDRASTAGVSGGGGGGSSLVPVRGTWDLAEDQAPTIVLSYAVPAQVTGVVATPGAREASVSWDAADPDVGSEPRSYVVTATPTGRGGSPTGGDVMTCRTFATSSPPATSCTVTGLVPGRRYAVTVEAVNGAGTGKRSAPSTVVVPRPAAPPPSPGPEPSPEPSPSPSSPHGNPSPLPPAAPVSAAARWVGDVIEVTWRSPESGDGPAATHHTVTAVPAGATGGQVATQTCVVPVPATSCRFTRLDPSTAYRFVVSAANAAGDSPGVEVLQAAGLPRPRPRPSPTPPRAGGPVPPAVTWAPPASDPPPTSAPTSAPTPDGSAPTLAPTPDGSAARPGASPGRPTGSAARPGTTPRRTAAPGATTWTSRRTAPSSPVAPSRPRVRGEVGLAAAPVAAERRARSVIPPATSSTSVPTTAPIADLSPATQQVLAAAPSTGGATRSGWRTGAPAAAAAGLTLLLVALVLLALALLMVARRRTDAAQPGPRHHT